jgi:hypothetical protein
MDESFVGRGNKNIKHLQSEYNLPPGSDAADRFLNSLSFLLKDKIRNMNEDEENNEDDAVSNEEGINNDGNETDSYSENVISNFVKSKDSESTLRFSDLLFLQQCTFESLGNGICKIHFYDTSGHLCKTKIWQGPLLYQWSIGNNVFPMHIFAKNVKRSGEHSVFSDYDKNPPNIRPSWLESELSNPCKDVDPTWCNTVRKCAYYSFNQTVRHNIYTMACDEKLKTKNIISTRKRKVTKVITKN